MSNSDRSIGDVLRLASGGPKLTVSEFGKHGSIHATWYDTDQYVSMWFPAGVLVWVEDSTCHNTFNVGDLVELASGGPLMTVSEVSSSNSIQCIWDHDNRFKSDAFIPSILRKKVTEDADRVTRIIEARAAAEDQLRNVE